MLIHLAMWAGLVYGLAGLYAAERLETRLLSELGLEGFWGKRVAHGMCMMAWPVLAMGIVTEGEKRP